VAWKYDRRPSHIRLAHMTLLERHFYEESMRRARAADLRDSLERITTLHKHNSSHDDEELIYNLPIFRPPENLPIPLQIPEPNPTKKVVSMRWPQVPGPVSVGLAETVQNADSLKFVDILCGISFVHALCGLRYGTSKEYYIQKMENTVLVQRVPDRNGISLLEPRRLAAEQFCNPIQQDHHYHDHVDYENDDDHSDPEDDHLPRIKYFTVGKFRVAHWLLKVVSEVPGLETDARVPIFIRATANPSTHNLEGLIHAVFSNSKQLVNFQYDEVQQQLTRMDIHSVQDLCFVHPQWPLIGQRFKYMLHRILRHTIVHEATEQPLILRFTRKKFPFFAKAPKGTSIVPPYTQELLRESTTVPRAHNSMLQSMQSS
jgi:hypothetical protein